MRTIAPSPAAVEEAGAPPAPSRLASSASACPRCCSASSPGAAPLAAMMFNVPLTVLGGGYGAPAAFLIATVVLTVFSVGYIEMSRRVTSAGGFYTFITRGLGPIPGALAIISMFAWFHIELTAKILGVALVAEVLALLVLA
ncbi:MAG: hypothetical protein QOD81_3079, partial [Solirubrobacteraceae bacterium]|nr:hypothetical protein [Solirubrobacteraceae bacterium]